MSLDVAQQVLDQRLLLLGLIFLLAHAHVQPHDDGAQQVALPRPPQPVRRVAQRGLEEQHEAHPLVVGVVLLAVLLAVVVGHAGVRHLAALAAQEGVGHGEGGRDPAVGVDGPRGQPLVHDALDGRAHVLRGGDHHRARQQQHRREQVVQPEHGVVHHDVLPLQILLEPSEKFIHLDRLLLAQHTKEKNTRLASTPALRHHTECFPIWRRSEPLGRSKSLPAARFAPLQQQSRTFTRLAAAAQPSSVRRRRRAWGGSRGF